MRRRWRFRKRLPPEWKSSSSLATEAMVKTYNISETKTHLSKLLEGVEAGQPFQIVRGKTVVAEVHPPKKPAGRGLRKLGLLEGKEPFDWEAWDALDEEIRKDFEESINKPFF